MWVNKLWVLVFVTGLIGCASTQKQTSANQLQMQLADLEKQLEAKDNEITGLQDKVDGLSEELKRKGSFKSTIAATSTEETVQKDGIIRVDVSPHKIQLALQNAGFYSGPIDGKVGEKTKKAIAEFQKANSLNPDGIIGRKTWDTLKTHLN